MEYQLEFLAMVDTDISFDELTRYLKERLPNAILVSPSVLQWSDNIVDVDKNEDFDPARTDDPDDGFIYYRYRLHVYPIAEHATLKHQMYLARTLKAALEPLSRGVEIAADFERLL